MKFTTGEWFATITKRRSDNIVDADRGRMRGTVCAGLRQADDYFGGVPGRQVVGDKTKAVVIERDAYGPGLPVSSTAARSVL